MGVGDFWKIQSQSGEGAIPKDNSQRFLHELHVPWPWLVPAFCSSSLAPDFGGGGGREEGWVAAPGCGNLKLSIYLHWRPVCRPFWHRHTAKSMRRKKTVEMSRPEGK